MRTQAVRGIGRAVGLAVEQGDDVAASDAGNGSRRPRLQLALQLPLDLLPRAIALPLVALDVQGYDGGHGIGLGLLLLHE